MDRQRLIDMLLNGRRAVLFLGDADAQTLEADEMRLYAVMHAVQIVGEAAHKVSKQTKEMTAHIEWGEAAGMRHLLVHGYNEIKVEIVVQTVRADLPILIGQLEELLGGETP